MDATSKHEATPNNRATIEQKSDRELVVTRLFNGPARLVFQAWTKPELLKRWWAPRSTGVVMIECELDVRAGARTASCSVTAAPSRWRSTAAISRWFLPRDSCGRTRKSVTETRSRR